MVSVNFLITSPVNDLWPIGHKAFTWTSDDFLSNWPPKQASVKSESKHSTFIQENAFQNICTTGKKSTLIQVIAWCNKPLPEPMLDQIYVTIYD